MKMSETVFFKEASISESGSTVQAYFKVVQKGICYEFPKHLIQTRDIRYTQLVQEISTSWF